VFALSTLMLLFTCVLVGVSKLVSGRRPKGVSNNTKKGK